MALSVMGPGISSSRAQGPQELLHHSSAGKVAKEGERMLREGFMPAAGAFSEEICWKCHPRLPGQTSFPSSEAA